MELFYASLPVCRTLVSADLAPWFNGNNTAISADAQTNGVDAVAIGYGARVVGFVDDAWNRAASGAVA
ncbi:Autotransporter adhesin [Xanthomonas fragariae LMG 25863]|nr:Autotransporter adhesin [Xanthomonas fragariae LMG 25863]